MSKELWGKLYGNVAFSQLREKNVPKGSRVRAVVLRAAIKICLGSERNK